MFYAQWRRQMVLVMGMATVACSSDGASKEETTGEVETSEDAGGRAPEADAGAASPGDSGAASSATDAATASDAGASQGGGAAQEVFYRLDKFVLKEPGLVLSIVGIETPVASEVQGMLDTSLKDDVEPMDGTVDLSLLMRFSGTSDPAKTAGQVTFGGGLCPYPADGSKPCGAETAAPFFEPAMSFSNANMCALEGGESVSGPCFESSMGRMAVNFLLFGPVALEDAQVVAAWAGSGGISEGWIRGFVSEETAKSTKIKGAVPSHLALVGVQSGTALTAFLPQAEREMRGGKAGWPFLVQFSAKPARFD